MRIASVSGLLTVLAFGSLALPARAQFAALETDAGPIDVNRDGRVDVVVADDRQEQADAREDEDSRRGHEVIESAVCASGELRVSGAQPLVEEKDIGP